MKTSVFNPTGRGDSQVRPGPFGVERRDMNYIVERKWKIGRKGQSKDWGLGFGRVTMV